MGILVVIPDRRSVPFAHDPHLDMRRHLGAAARGVRRWGSAGLYAVHVSADRTADARVAHGVTDPTRAPDRSAVDERPSDRDVRSRMGYAEGRHTPVHGAARDHPADDGREGAAGRRRHAPLHRARVPTVG